ncbi:MAG: polymer-forming cytoskeletal protein [Rhodocyclaceae bacterium]|nr:polymer-forming cytoskeletal protein [Rhodocyclaceae bacterium]
MFGKKEINKHSGQIDSLIGVGTRVEGNIFFAGGLRIDGEVKGNVEASGDVSSILVISEHARIDGDVMVSHLVLNGAIFGAVTVSESLEVQPKARVVGDVDYALIEMHQGAVIEGRLTHRANKSVELKLAASN